MTIMEIALLIIGVIIFVISFLLPDSGDKKTEKEIEAEKKNAETQKNEKEENSKD